MGCEIRCDSCNPPCSFKYYNAYRGEGSVKVTLIDRSELGVLKGRIKFDAKKAVRTGRGGSVANLGCSTPTLLPTQHNEFIGFVPDKLNTVKKIQDMINLVMALEENIGYT